MTDALVTSGGPRLIFAHSQATSGRLRFVRFAHGMLGFAPLPTAARLPADDEWLSPQVVTLPSVHLAKAEQRLGLPPASLRIEAEFRQAVRAGSANIDVHLARFTATDPPFDAIATQGARFVAITETRGCPPLELALLRKAYEVILGG